jgi:YggT family protein
VTSLIASIINFLANALFLLVILHVILSYVMAPYHPLRRWIDSIVEPLLNPIRRILPPIGGLDFSPVVLIILIRIVSSFIIQFLR